MNLAIKIYDAFQDDHKKAEVLVEAFSILDKEKISGTNAATKSDLTETSLKLLLEIEKNRTEIEKVRSDLTKEIEKNRTEIEKVKSDLIKFIHRQTIWTIGAISVIIGALKALDYFLK